MPPEPVRRQEEARWSLLHGCIALCAALLAGSVIAAPKAAATEPSGSSAVVAKADTKKAARSKAKPKASAKGKAGAKDKASAKAREQKPGPLADFRGEAAPPDVVHVANWVSYTRNQGKRAFVVIDKKDARMYVFDRQGKLKSRSEILLGKAVGDTTAPGVGNKPISQLKEEEKTTPAGRFLARPGKNTRGDDIIWIDYDAAVSMHRMRKVSAAERRAERMASDTPEDNRISNGCVNVPHAFYDKVLKPTVLKQGAYIYVLPETRPAQQLFGSFDVPPAGKKAKVAREDGAKDGKPAKS